MHVTCCAHAEHASRVLDPRRPFLFLCYMSSFAMLCTKLTLWDAKACTAVYNMHVWQRPQVYVLHVPSGLPSRAMRPLETAAAGRTFWQHTRDGTQSPQKNCAYVPEACSSSTMHACICGCL